MEEISQAELDERVAILRKFRALLEQQRKKFQEYLAVLEKQEHSIEEEDTEALVAHAELEQAIQRADEKSRAKTAEQIANAKK